MALGRRKARAAPGPVHSDVPVGRTLSVLVCYDIADDGRREDIAAELAALGPRVQLSVFECRVRGRAELDQLISRLKALVDPIEDQIRVYNFGSRPAAAVLVGQRTLEEWRDYWIV